MADGYWLLHTDGASLGNPGLGGAGAVVYDENESLVSEVSIHLGKVTNNEAEYQGLIEGLKEALKLGAKRLHIRMDSELIVRHILGIYKVKNARLAVLFAEVKELLKQLEEYDIAHVRREFNSQADALASKAAKLPLLNKKYDDDD